MVLVDEKLLEYQPMLHTKQDMSWKRPMEQTVKSSLSSQMKSTLDDPAIPDDVKVKQYRQNLNRFLHAKRKLPEPPPDEPIKEPEPPKKATKKKKKTTRWKRTPMKTTEPIKSPTEPRRVSTRISIRRKPFTWDRWT